MYFFQLEHLFCDQTARSSDEEEQVWVPGLRFAILEKRVPVPGLRFAILRALKLAGANCNIAGLARGDIWQIQTPKN